MSTTERRTAWDMIGFEGDGASVRIVGGRALYEAVDFNDAGRQRLVRLARLDVTPTGLRQVNRYVDPDTMLEVIPDAMTPPLHTILVRDEPRWDDDVLEPVRYRVIADAWPNTGRLLLAREPYGVGSVAPLDHFDLAEFREEGR